MGRRVLFLLCAFIPSLNSIVEAQTEAATGVMTGVVTDASGTILQGVAIEIRHLETGSPRRAVSNDQGYFRAALLSGPECEKWIGESIPAFSWSA